MITLRSFVCADWHTGVGTPTPLYNPTTEEVLAETGSDGIDYGDVLSHAREKGLPGLQALGFSGRATMLKGLSAAVHEHREELIELAISNGGNTRGHAKFDIDGAIGTLAAYASYGKELGDGNVLPDGEGVQLGRTARFWGQHVRVPRQGVAVHINAFNFPSWGMGEKMACALLAGVPVIEKPGTPSALLAWRMAEIFVQGGLLPEGSFQFIAGRTGDLLDRLGPQDALAFTGSSGTGASFRSNPNLLAQAVRVNIEADSLNAAILAPDVDASSDTYGAFLDNVVRDMTQKAGQKCTAVRRIMVPADRVADVSRDLAEGLARIVVGDPAERETRMGPLASRRQLEDVRTGIGNLQTAAELVCGGADPIRDKGYFVAPTLLVASDGHADALHAEEVFGPVATILPYSGDAAEAIQLANRGAGGLVASLYSNDKDWTEAVILGISPWTGRIWIGSDRVVEQSFPPGAVLPQMIHGGPGRAGAGEELGGLRGLEFYTQRTALQGFQGHLKAAYGS